MHRDFSRAQQKHHPLQTDTPFLVAKMRSFLEKKSAQYLNCMYSHCTPMDIIYSKVQSRRQSFYDNLEYSFNTFYYILIYIFPMHNHDSLVHRYGEAQYRDTPAFPNYRELYKTLSILSSRIQSPPSYPCNSVLQQ